MDPRCLVTKSQFVNFEFLLTKLQKAPWEPVKRLALGWATWECKLGRLWLDV